MGAGAEIQHRFTFRAQGVQGGFALDPSRDIAADGEVAALRMVCIDDGDDLRLQPAQAAIIMLGPEDLAHPPCPGHHLVDDSLDDFGIGRNGEGRERAAHQRIRRAAEHRVQRGVGVVGAHGVVMQGHDIMGGGRDLPQHRLGLG